MIGEKIKRLPFVSIPLLGLSFLLNKFWLLVKRDNMKWVYGCHWRVFDSNPKFFFLEQNEQHPEIRSIWISRNKTDVVRIRKLGLESYYWASIRGLYHTLTAGVFVGDSTVHDVNRYLSGGAVYLGLHHGIGVKASFWKAKEAYAKRYHMSADRLEKSIFFRVMTDASLYRKPNIWLATSHAHARDVICPMHRADEKDCIFANFPRNKILLWDKEKIKLMAERYEPKQTLDSICHFEKFDKVYIYMPTWRKSNDDFIKASGIDFNMLNKALKKNNALFVLKLHPSTIIDKSKSVVFSNITFFSKESDVYYVLPFTDCLITDYSSIYTDYLIMDKQVILYPFDYTEYVKFNFELIDYDNLYKGRKATQFSELLKFVEENVDCHIGRIDYKKLMDYYWDSLNNNVDIATEVLKRVRTLRYNK